MATAHSPGRPTVACPTCGTRLAWSTDNPWRPFCSERCRTNDLGAWAAESYRIPVKGGEGEEGDSVDGVNNPPA